MTAWASRGTLAAGPPSGWVHLSSPECAIGTSAAEIDRLAECSATALAAAGLTASDRVVVALTADGVSPGPLLQRAAVALGATAATVSPRGRTRILRALRSLGATTLVATPCGALDLLARIFLEFGLQPEDLGLARILVGGEIPSPGSLRQLGDEFDCDVRRLLLDPFTGAALAQGVDHLEPAAPDAVARALVDRDELASPGGSGASELVVRGAGAWLRTGEVVVGTSPPGTIPPTTHTVGDHVLARGRWLSLPAIDAALSGIDGVAAWRLDVSREGTLDRVVVTVGLDRPTLVDDRMWAGRIREAVASVVPVRVETAALAVEEQAWDERVRDERGHHLGVDRATATLPVGVG